MSMFTLIIAAFIGLVCITSIILLVVVVVISRREDFVNPFSSKKPERQPEQKVSAQVYENVPPHLYARPVSDQESALVDWLLAQASAQSGMNLSQDQMAVERIADAARKAMKELEGQDSTHISLPFLTADGSGPMHFEIFLSRTMLEQLR